MREREEDEDLAWADILLGLRVLLLLLLSYYIANTNIDYYCLLLCVYAFTVHVCLLRRLKKERSLSTVPKQDNKNENLKVRKVQRAETRHH